MNNRIKELRKQKKITQDELAKAVEVTRQTIISLENGKYNASIIKNEAMLVFGTAFGTCGLVMIVKNIRIFKSTDNFIEKEIAEKDERNIMIWTKARSLTFSVYAVIAGIAIIVLYTVNMEYAAQVIAYNLCGVLVIYWICYFIIRNKY